MSAQQVSAPEWLTVAYIEKALQNGLNDPNLKVKNCEIAPATAVGENYGSIMLRIRLTVFTKGKDEDLSVIAKLPPDSIYVEKHKDRITFQREIKMFTKTIPSLNEFLRKVYPKQENLSAKCYFQEEDPDGATCIFLEDLRQSGFTLADRFAGLDLDHATLVLRNLAKFHASSLLYVEKDPDLSLYDMDIWRPEFRDMFASIYEKPVKCIAENIRNWENYPKKEVYYEKLKTLEKTILDKFFDAYKRDDSKLNVICHGDAWLNNIMFRYDEKNKVNGLRFIDFQMSNYNSPAIDLNYFIFLSSRQRFTDIDSLLKIYHETFTETLKGLNYELKKPFTLDILKKEFQSKLSYGLATVLAVLPITTVPPSKAVKLDAILNKDNAEANQVYEREEFMDILKVALPFFEKYGAF